VLLYTDAHWRDFFRLVDRPDLADDPELTSIRGRTRRIDELYRLVDDELARRPTAHWLRVLRERHVPAMPVNTVDDLFDDEHLAAVGFFEQVEHPTEGTLVHARLPWTFGRSGAPVLPGAPALGQHTEETLRRLGLDDDAVRAAGTARPVTGERPAPG
jgi:crotonobetainyl-CoA:carnitine CoA-transferase CaiB-like acyl-CoA transferase